MGKFKSWKYRGLFKDICVSACLLGASAGLVFGVSAGTFKVNYTDLNSSEIRVKSANSAFSYYSQDIKSQWNMEYDAPSGQKVEKAEWDKLHNNAEMLMTDKLYKDMEAGTDYGAPISADAIKARYNYVSMVIDGATHSTMDRSFNQGLYNGLVDFIQNKNVLSTELQPETENDPTKNCAKSFKPGGDNTTEFINIFNTVAKTYRVVGLAGFNHVTPLNALGKYNKTSKRVEFTNPDIDKTAFLLIDGDVANNQNVGSVLFRADQPGFLAAISTCMYFYNNLGIYHNNFQDLSIGLYGGTSIPTVTIYMGGAQRGIEFFNEAILKWSIIHNEIKDVIKGVDPAKGKANWDQYPDAKKLYLASKYKEEIDKLIAKATVTDAEWEDIATKIYNEFEIKQIKLGDASTHFSGTFASGDAIGITKQYLNRGACAIMAVAGPQSLDSAQEIQNQKSNCIVIGVDSAMEEGDYQRKFTSGASDSNVAPDGTKPAQKDNIIKFSAVKDMTSVTQKFAALSAMGYNFDTPDRDEPNKPDPERSVCGIGYKTCGNIQNGLISISWDGLYPLIQALQHLKKIYRDGESGLVQKTFKELWAEATDIYAAEHELSEEFRNIIRDSDNLCTYDKGKFNGLIYKNYNHVMAILGVWLKYTYFTVPTYMTVKQEQYQEEGKTKIRYVPETVEKMMTVLDWLKLNMYFSN